MNPNENNDDRISTEGVDKLIVSSESFAPTGQHQGERHDKKVVYNGSKGTRRLSSILYGHDGDTIENGTYVLAEHLVRAMYEALDANDDEVVLVTGKGEPVDPDELIEVAKLAAGYITIGGKSSAFPRQETSKWEMHRPDTGEQSGKGVALFGLQPGEYINAEAFKKVVGGVVPKPPEPPKKPEPPTPPEIPRAPEIDPVPEPTIQDEQSVETVRVVRKYKNNLSAWLAGLAVALVLASGFAKVPIMKSTVVPSTSTKSVVHLTDEEFTRLGYKATGTIETEIMETVDEAMERARLAEINGLQLGNDVTVADGTIVESNSAYTGKSGQIRAGDYTITGVSIVKNQKMLNYIEAFNEEDTITNVGKFVADTCATQGLDIKDINVRIHIGSTLKGNRAGWIDVTDLINEAEITPEKVSKVVSEITNYSGEIEDFRGDTIKIDTPSGEAEIRVRDENGDLLAPGATIIGSDGREYTIQELNEETEVVTREDTEIIDVTHDEIVEEEVGSKITWRIEDCELGLGLLPLVGALAAAIVTANKNKKEEENPTFIEFEDQAEREKFIEEFKRAKEEYEKSSKFSAILRRVFIGSKEDNLMDLTDEQAGELFDRIRTVNSDEYTYSPDDRIVFGKNGQILAYHPNKTVTDITEAVMPRIAPIGQDNKVTATGLLVPNEEETDQKPHGRR